MNALQKRSPESGKAPLTGEIIVYGGMPIVQLSDNREAIFSEALQDELKGSDNLAKLLNGERITKLNFEPGTEDSTYPKIIQFEFMGEDLDQLDTSPETEKPGKIEGVVLNTRGSISDLGNPLDILNRQI